MPRVSLSDHKHKKKMHIYLTNFSTINIALYFFPARNKFNLGLFLLYLSLCALECHSFAIRKHSKLFVNQNR